jgi:hypothetical protein
VSHATAHLGALSDEVAVAIRQLAPYLLTPMSEYLDSLSPANAVDALRHLLTQTRTVTDQQWADALETDAVGELMTGLLGPGAKRSAS